MYKYIGTEDGAQGYKHSTNDIFVRGFPKDLKPEIKGRRIYRLCNPPEDINLGSEGKKNPFKKCNFIFYLCLCSYLGCNFFRTSG